MIIKHSNDAALTHEHSYHITLTQKELYNLTTLVYANNSFMFEALAKPFVDALNEVSNLDNRYGYNS